MKAVVCRTYGGPELANLEDVPAPAMSPGGVRIRVEACSASFASLLVMEGKHQNRAPLPLIPGTEVAGTVIEADTAATRFRPGDRVIAGVQSGGYAQEVDRKSTRLNSSHVKISYAVLCLKKKKNEKNISKCKKKK